MTIHVKEKDILLGVTFERDHKWMKVEWMKN
jgi:hypothetical protein